MSHLLSPCCRTLITFRAFSLHFSPRCFPSLTLCSAPGPQQILQHQSYLCFLQRTLRLISSITAAQRAAKRCSVTYNVGRRQRAADALLTLRCTDFWVLSPYPYLQPPTFQSSPCSCIFLGIWDQIAVKSKSQVGQNSKTVASKQNNGRKTSIKRHIFYPFSGLFSFQNPPHLQKTNFNPLFTASC